MPPGIFLWPTGMPKGDCMSRQPNGVLWGKVLLVFMGLTAGGKSTLAEAYAERSNGMHINTDRVRKRLAGIEPTRRRPDKIDQGIYSPELTERTYQQLLDQAEDAFAAGSSLVLLDGSYAKRTQRECVRARGREMEVAVLFIYCFCTEEETRRRLEMRSHDDSAVSDGRWEIYQHQKQTFELPDQEEDCICFATSGEVEPLLRKLDQRIQEYVKAQQRSVCTKSG